MAVTGGPGRGCHGRASRDRGGVRVLIGRRLGRVGQFVERRSVPGYRLVQHGPEDGADRRGDGADQCQGLHAVLVRPRYRHQVQLQRLVCRVRPPVTGPATAGPGVTGKLAVITRSDGSKQATYDGHPLYTYVGDTAPGQAKGNGLNLSGGVWHEMTASGGPAPAPSASQSSSSGGGY